MSQYFDDDELLDDAARSFDELIGLSPKYRKEVLELPLYGVMMQALLEAAATIRFQFIQLYCLGKQLSEAEAQEPDKLGPTALIDPQAEYGKEPHA